VLRSYDEQKLLFGIFAIAVVFVAGWWLLSSNYHQAHEHNEIVIAHTAVAKIGKISVWEFGKEKVIEIDTISQ